MSAAKQRQNISGCQPVTVKWEEEKLKWCPGSHYTHTQRQLSGASSLSTSWRQLMQTSYTTTLSLLSLSLFVYMGVYM